jgi:hypothetical protein
MPRPRPGVDPNEPAGFSKCGRSMNQANLIGDRREQRESREQMAIHH